MTDYDFDDLAKNCLKVLLADDPSEADPIFEIGDVYTSTLVDAEMAKLDGPGKRVAVMQILLEGHRTLVQGLACDEDHEANRTAAENGYRVISVFPWFSSSKLAADMPNLEPQPKVWVITEADRSSTTLLFPEEY